MSHTKRARTDRSTGASLVEAHHCCDSCRLTRIEDDRQRSGHVLSPDIDYPSQSRLPQESYMHDMALDEGSGRLRGQIPGIPLNRSDLQTRHSTLSASNDRSCSRSQSLSIQQIPPSQTHASIQRTHAVQETSPWSQQYCSPLSINSKTADARDQDKSEPLFHSRGLSWQDILGEAPFFGSTQHICGNNQHFSQSQKSAPAIFKPHNPSPLGLDFDSLHRYLTPPSSTTGTANDSLDPALEEEMGSMDRAREHPSTPKRDNKTNSSWSPLTSNESVLAQRRDQPDKIDSEPNCTALALNSLRALHSPRQTCLCSSNSELVARQPRMTDSVLSINKNAIDAIGRILRCTCSSHAQTQILLTLICTQLIVWYRAIVAVDHSDSTDPTVSSASPSGFEASKTHSDRIEQVFYQPITIGEYYCHSKVDRKIRAHLVSSELQRLARLMSNFFGRREELEAVCEFAKGQKGPDRESKIGVTETVQKSLSSSIREELQAAKKEIRLLFGGHDTQT
ncbi:MAG: hypothetical protein LQ342_004248 [Letrouitia transgressa]|nr:MAG: hypothetical protein LQ342_004248 [Letrouitia transgressa]